MFDLEILMKENKPCSQSVIKYDFANLVQVYYQNTHSYGIYVASGRPSRDPCGPCLRFCSLFRQFCVNVFQMCCFQSASLVFVCYIIYGAVTSCVTSCVTSQCRTCTCHMIFYYKRSASASFWALFALASSFGSWFIQQVCPCHLHTAGV